MNRDASIVAQIVMKMICECEEVIDRCWDITIGDRIRDECYSNVLANRWFVPKVKFGDFIIGEKRDDGIDAKRLH